MTHFFYRLPLSSSSSQRGGAAAQASRQTAPSPADAAQLELLDLGVEDVLELQLQQLSLAQFTVATMEHAIPLLRTGRSERLFACVFEHGVFSLSDYVKVFQPTLLINKSVISPRRRACVPGCV